MDYYKGVIPIIDNSPEGRAYSMPSKIDGVPVSYGYAPHFAQNDPDRHLIAAPPSDMVVYQESDYDALYDEQEATKSSLEHLFLPNGPNGPPAFLNLDQNGHGDCWLFSGGHGIMIDRLKQGLPLVRLNPHAGAVILNHLNGGWCGLSAKLYREIGCAEEGNGPGQWPGHSHDRRYDTPELRARMANYKVTEDWVDLSKDVYDQNLTRLQQVSVLFNNIPSPRDFNWQGHSVLGMRWVRIERGSWGLLILNSWLGWGRHGLGVYRGSQAWADGCVAFRSSTPSLAA